MAVQGKAWLGRQVGVSKSRISQLVKQGRVPNRAAYTSADVKRLKAHLLDARALNNSSVAQLEKSGEDSAIDALAKNPERVARVKQIIERTAMLKLNRQIKTGMFVPRAKVEAENVAQAFAVRQKLQELPLRAVRLVKKTEAECAAILREWVEEISDFYAAGWSNR